MFGSSSKKDGGRVIGIIDIGSAQVNGVIVKLNKAEEIEKVFAQTDEKISYQELPEFEHFWTVTQKAIQIVFQELKAQLAGADKSPDLKVEPEKIYVFLASPFFQSQTKVIKAENPNPLKITKNYLANLVKQANDQDSPADKVVILEDRVMQTKLDGYLTTWPIGQKAKEIIINHFLSWADKDLLIKLRDTIHTEYAKAPIIFNTFSFAIYSIFKNLLPEKDFILIDTGNEITDILIIKDNVLAEHFSFPKGKNFLIREIAKELKTIPAEAESALSLLAEDKANPQLKARLRPVLDKVGPLWQADLRQILTKALETTLLPENIYFISDDLTDSLFAQFVEQADFSEVTLSNHKLSTIFIEKLLADSLAHLTGKVQPITNSYLLAETLFCAKINGK